MSDKEVALKLTELKGAVCDVNYLNTYFEMLEGIRNQKSETVVGKIEELLYEYNKSNYSSFSKDRFIEGVEDIIRGEE